MLERDLQKAIISQYGQLQAIYGNRLNYAIMSFGEVYKPTARAQGINNSMGYVQGSPDLIVLGPGTISYFVELKRPGINIANSIMATQKPFIDMLSARGIEMPTTFINDINKFWALIKSNGGNYTP